MKGIRSERGAQGNLLNDKLKREGRLQETIDESQYFKTNIIPD